MSRPVRRLALRSRWRRLAYAPPPGPRGPCAALLFRSSVWAHLSPLLGVSHVQLSERGQSAAPLPSWQVFPRRVRRYG